MIRIFALSCLGLLIQGCLTDPTSILVQSLQVISWSPNGGTLCVRPELTIFVTFSDDILDRALTENSLYLMDSEGVVPTTMEYDRDTFTLSLTPSEILSYEQLYTVVGTSDLEGRNTGRLPTEVSASFMTVSRQGCVPAVQCSLPSDCSDGQVCANIGTCVDECITDRDCQDGVCDQGSCEEAPSAPDDGDSEIVPGD